MKFLCDQCKTKYQIADEKAAGKTLRMKCRKCGHLIEVRAATAATTIASTPPPAGPSPAAPPGPPPRPAGKPAAAALASNLAAAKPAARPEKPVAKPEKPGALAGAFKTNVKDDEVSAPFDMSDLSGNDEWYVAVNGVPVGPIRVAEIRRKAANGAVTEDSLAWQEGLDEWRPVRTFPDLAAVVREAIATGRTSLTPLPPEGRPSYPPPRSASTRSSIGPQHSSASRGVLRPHQQPGGEAAAARSNVVPISSRLATAERLAADELAIPVESEPLPEPVAHADPFAAPSPARPAPAPSVQPSISMPPPRKRQAPWAAMAVVAGLVFAFAAGATFFRPAPTQQIIYQPVATPAGPTAPAAPTSSVADAPPDTSAAPTKGPVAGGGPRNGGSAPTTAAPAKGTIDLGGLKGGRVSPMDNAGEEQRAPGQCLTSAQVGGVIGQHQVGVRRACWDKSPSTKPAANVSVSLTVGSDGSAQGVSASGDEASVAKCVEDNVRQWRFPSMGCTQAVNIPFHFVR